MHIFVGSSNPVKVNAVKSVVDSFWSDVVVNGYSVSSGVAEQPTTDIMTKKGATNRAQAALKSGLVEYKDKKFTRDQVLGIGLEGGVFIDHADQMWSTVWVVVADQTGFTECSNGARFKVPDAVSQKIRTGGEMGPIMAEITKINSVKTKQGMIGVITDGFVTRTAEYIGIVSLAIGLWYGRDWSKNYV